LKAIGDKLDLSVANLLISYQVARGCVALPKSVTPKRIADNLETHALSEEDVRAIDGIAARGKQKRVNAPDWGSDLGFSDWFDSK
jgi:glycerol 2-dehydrogenase (NADP+)